MSRSGMMLTALTVLLLRSTFVTAEVPVPSLKALVQSSDRIVADVIRIGETVEETVNLNPEGDPARIVCTYLEIEPTEHLKGTPTEKLTVRLLGGFINGYAIIDADAPPIVDGEQAMLFLAKSEMPKKGSSDEVYRLPYAIYGKFRIEEKDSQRVVKLPLPAQTLGITDGSGTANVLEYARLRELVEHEKGASREN